MRGLIVRLNTLILTFSFLVGILLGPLESYRAYQSRPSNCFNRHIKFKEENPTTGAGNFYDYSKNPPELKPWDEIADDNICNQWREPLFLALLQIFVIFLCSAIGSWLFGAGFRIHTRFRNLDV